MTAPARPVGLAGLGLVGSALAARLIEAGQAVLGWDPDPARRAALAEVGGTAADGSAALGRDCTSLIVAVFDLEQAADLISNLPQGERRATLICVTTCDPDGAQRLAGLAAAKGWGFVEFPISGTSREIREGTATGLLGGDEADGATLASLLATVCPRYRRVGGIGAAAGMKLAVNLVLQLNRAALAEGIVLAERLGLDPATFLEVAQGSAAASAVMAGKGPKMIGRDFAPESRIAQTLKDAELILAAAAAAGQPLPLMRAGAGLLRWAVSSGGGDRDSAAVVEAVRELACKDDRTP